MTQQSEREAFEKYAKSEGYMCPKYSDGSYRAIEWQQQWIGWQACANARPHQPQATIKTDNTQVLYNALERIKELEAQIQPQASAEVVGQGYASVHGGCAILHRRCPHCGGNLIHNQTGVECGAIHCSYAEGGEKYINPKAQATLPQPALNVVEDWEFFRDASYYDMWAVRNKRGNADFNSAIHVATEAEAQFLVERLNGASLPTQRGLSEEEAEKFIEDSAPHGGY